MNNDELFKKIDEYADAAAQLGKTATTDEHDESEDEIFRFAKDEDFLTDETLPSGKNPDVLRSKGKELLLGDAKYSKEPPNKDSTANQIDHYVSQVRKFFEAGKYTSAILIIATDTEAAGKEWVEALGLVIRGNKLKIKEPPGLEFYARSDVTWFVMATVTLK